MSLMVFFFISIAVREQHENDGNFLKISQKSDYSDTQRMKKMRCEGMLYDFFCCCLSVN